MSLYTHIHTVCKLTLIYIYASSLVLVLYTLPEVSVFLLHLLYLNIFCLASTRVCLQSMRLVNAVLIYFLYKKNIVNIHSFSLTKPKIMFIYLFCLSIYYYGYCLFHILFSCFTLFQCFKSKYNYNYFFLLRIRQKLKWTTVSFFISIVPT